MSFLKNIIRNAVGDGISKGIRDAVSSAAEKAVAPKAEAYAATVADSLDEAAQSAEKYAETWERAAAAPEDLLKEWNEKVPGFPVWGFGGTDFHFEENGTSSDGNTYYLFEADNVTEEGLHRYVALLKKDGFASQQKDWDDVLYKDLGGEYLVFSKVEAFNAAPHMTLGMFRTKDRKEFDC